MKAVGGREKKEMPPLSREKYVWLKGVSVKLFGSIADKYEESFGGLKKSLVEADIKILFRTYFSIISFLSFIGFFLSIIFITVVLSILNFSVLQIIMFSVVLPIGIASSVFTFGYFYPASRATSRKKSIEMNMPFAVNHMAAIASSGVPPYTMFRLLTGFGEYGEISKEAEKIVRNIDVFGQDIATALRDITNRTPSPSFREILEGILSTIETGGNLQAYLKQQSDKELFEYRIKREKYLEVLSTYADFYTAVMIAAPLFLVAVLAIMNMIGGKLWGMEISDVMNIGIFALIPVVNIGFLLFVHYTQPEL